MISQGLWLLKILCYSYFLLPGRSLITVESVETSRYSFGKKWTDTLIFYKKIQRVSVHGSKIKGLTLEALNS